MCNVTRLCPQSKVGVVAQGWIIGREMCIGRINASSVVRACFGGVSDVALPDWGETTLSAIWFCEFFREIKFKKRCLEYIIAECSFPLAWNTTISSPTGQRNMIMIYNG